MTASGTAAAERRAELAHLYRRIGFGASPTELAAAVEVGYEATVDALLAAATAAAASPDASALVLPELDYVAPPEAAAGAEQLRAYRRTVRAQIDSAVAGWLDRMTRTGTPVLEKLTLGWHDHWATSVVKVRSAPLMVGQNTTLRRLGLGGFGDLAAAMVVDPAMLVWLDGPRNRGGSPNENLGRELMELFVLGVGEYGESDVREASRALTGWTVDRQTGEARFVPGRHDAGSKTVLGRTERFDAVSLVEHLVSQPACARHLASVVWGRLAGASSPPVEVTDRLTASFGADRDLRALVRAVLCDPSFRAAENRNTLVRQPVDWAVSAMRALAVRIGPAPDAGRNAGPDGGPDGGPDAGSGPDSGFVDPATVSTALAGMGQVPFAPPSVGGWPAGRSWLTTAAGQVRWEFAASLAAAANLSAVEDVAPAARADLLAGLLTVDGWSTRTAAALAAVRDSPADLVTVALAAPEFVVC